MALKMKNRKKFISTIAIEDYDILASHLAHFNENVEIIERLNNNSEQKKNNRTTDCRCSPCGGKVTTNRFIFCLNISLMELVCCHPAQNS